nr:hypothetical protein [Tanacetum cinerariifolium]
QGVLRLRASGGMRALPRGVEARAGGVVPENKVGKVF